MQQIDIFTTIERKSLPELQQLIQGWNQAVALATFDARGFTALHAASAKGWIEGVQALLSKKIFDIDCKDKFGQDKTPLFIAAYEGKTEIVKVLLACGANPNVADKDYGATPLHYASRIGFLMIVNALISSGADINKVDNADFSTPLHLAAEAGRKQVVDALVRAGADCTILDSFGDTYLMRAAINTPNSN